jgi:hypothetical protein
MANPWNVNIHYDGKLDACVPTHIAVDIGRPVLQRAKHRFPGAQVVWTHGDFLAASERLGSFDAVVSNAG